jgi:protein O-GlcNAc transferase
MSPCNTTLQNRACNYTRDECEITSTFSGTTTSCEALWMGVPVITLTGTKHSQNTTESILRAVGFDLLTKSCIATSEEDYIAKAVSLALDLPRLKEIRSNLRERVVGSSLCDRRGYMGALEREYARIVEERVEKS